MYLNINKWIQQIFRISKVFFQVSLMLLVSLSITFCQNSSSAESNKKKVDKKPSAVQAAKPDKTAKPDKAPIVNKDTIKLAETKLKKRRYSDVVEQLGKIPEEKRDYKILSLLGQAYFFLGQYAKAQPLFEQSLEKLAKRKDINKFEQGHLHSLLGYIHQKLKNYDLALSQYQKTVNLLPKQVKAWVNLGSLYLEKEEYSKAEKAFLQGHKLKPDYASVLAGLGKVYYHLEQYPKGLTYLKLLLKKVPNSSDGYLWQGKIFLKTNKKREGYEMVAKGYFLANKPVEAINNIENIPDFKNNKELFKLYTATLVKGQLYKKAESEISQAIKQYPKDVDFVFDLSQVYYRQKQYDKSLQTALGGLKIFPRNHYLHVVAASSYKALKKDEQATQYYEKALDIEIRDTMARERLAQIYRLNKNQENNPVKKKNQENLEFFHQAVVYYYSGDLKQAEVIFDWIDKKFHRMSELQYFKGMIALKKNDKKAAVEYFKASILENESLYLPYIALAETYQSLNKAEDAKVLLNKYMTKYPKAFHINKVKEALKKLTS